MFADGPTDSAFPVTNASGCVPRKFLVEIVIDDKSVMAKNFAVK